MAQRHRAWVTTPKSCILEQLEGSFTAISSPFSLLSERVTGALCISGHLLECCELPSSLQGML